MFPPGTSMTGFTPQQWAAAFASMTGQPAVANTQAFQIGGVDSNGVVLGAVAPGYVRIAQNASQSSVLSGSTLATGPYAPHHPTLGYAIQPSVENPVAGRQLPSANLTPPYPLQHYTPTGSVSQTLPYSHTSLPYELSYPYIPPLIPSLCNGGLAHVQQCSAIPAQQAALVSGFEPSLRVFDSLKSFNALSQDQNRRNRSMITSKTNLYISGLNESDTDETVRSLVKDVVQPKSCKAMISNGTCKGYGFIDCSTEEDAERAKNHITEYAKITGRKLLVKFAHENEKDVLNVYVRHLPLDFTKEKLEELFRKYGQITSVKLLENEDRLTGIGFVRYALAEQAERAIEQMNAEKLVLGNNTAPVMCKLADKANTRRRAMAASTLMLQQSFPLNNPLQRHNVSLNSSTSVHRGSGSIPQAQQSGPLATGVPFTTQLISQLNQPQVILQNMQTTPASPHARSVLPSGVLPSCSSGSSLLPMSFSSVAPGALCPTASNRATPLIGPPPPTTPISVGPLQTNQNSTNVATAYMTPVIDIAQNASSKMAAVSVPTSRFPNVITDSTYLHGDGSSFTDPAALNGMQLNTLPATSQYTSSFTQQHPQTPSSSGAVAINPQLLLLSHASGGCVSQTSAASVSSNFAYGHFTPQSVQTFPSPHPSEGPKTPIQPATIYSQVNSHTDYVSPADPSPVALVSSGMQTLSLKMQNKQPVMTSVEGSHHSGSGLWESRSDPTTDKVDETSEIPLQSSESCPVNYTAVLVTSAIEDSNQSATSTIVSVADNMDDSQCEAPDSVELKRDSIQLSACSSPLDAEGLAVTTLSTCKSFCVSTHAPVPVTLGETDMKLSFTNLVENRNGMSSEQDVLEGTWSKRTGSGPTRKCNEFPSSVPSHRHRQSENTLTEGRSVQGHSRLSRRRKTLRDPFSCNEQPLGTDTEQTGKSGDVAVTGTSIFSHANPSSL